MKKFHFKNLKEADTFGINQKPLAFHIVTFLKRVDDNLYFFDSTVSETIYFNKDNFVRGLSTPTDAAYNKKTPCIEYIETIPDYVFEVIKHNANYSYAKETKLYYNLLQKS